MAAAKLLIRQPECGTAGKQRGLTPEAKHCWSIRLLLISVHSTLRWHYLSPSKGATRAQTDTAMGKIYQVVVHGFKGEILTIDLCNTEEQFKTMTVLQLKEKIIERLPETAGVGALRLIFTDKMLDGEAGLLSEYGIQNQSHIHMVLKVPGGLTA
ncbi:hypothetical protein NQZ68_011928 [Dissostichus eleginoides]|nr:hypothetical protein NQZ68_011928 [Dissostichus eleginoides]